VTFFQSLILGLVQGLTEFLPISSSGHLVLVEHLLDVVPSTDITFEVFVHFGTLMSVVVVMWKDILAIIQSTVKALTGGRLSREYYDENEQFRLALAIVVGSVPAAVIGLLFEDAVTAAFTDPKMVSVMLVLTGLILFLTRLAEPVENKNVGILSAIMIGIAQAIAIVPGISRSGFTISTAVYLRISPLNAARFSFLLSIPVIAGATLLKTKDLVFNGFGAESVLHIAGGTLMAFLSGYVAIKVLLKIVQQGKFSIFAFYCLIAGSLGIIFI